MFSKVEEEEEEDEEEEEELPPRRPPRFVSCFGVGFLYHLELPFPRSSTFATGSTTLVHDADAVVGRKTRNCSHKQN